MTRDGPPQPVVAPGPPQPVVAPGPPQPVIAPGPPQPVIAPGPPQPVVAPADLPTNIARNPVGDPVGNPAGTVAETAAGPAAGLEKSLDSFSKDLPFSEDLTALKERAGRWKQRTSQCQGQWSGNPNRTQDETAFKKYRNSKDSLKRAKNSMQKAEAALTAENKSYHIKRARKSAQTSRRNAEEALSRTRAVLRDIEADRRALRSLRDQALRDKQQAAALAAPARLNSGDALFRIVWAADEKSRIETRLKEVAGLLIDVEAAKKGARQAVLRMQKIKAGAEALLQEISGRAARPL